MLLIASYLLAVIVTLTEAKWSEDILQAMRKE